MSYKKIIKQIKTDRMEQAVLIASQLFLENGIENVAMTDIAKACDVGVASLYRYFGTKTTLVIKSGTLLWEDLQLLFDGVFDTEDYLNKTGMEQLSELLDFFNILYSSHKNFLRFTHDFDLFIIKEKVGKAELIDYENSILNILPMFEKAYEKGCTDGTVKPGLDARILFFTISHALMSLCQRFISGVILTSDKYVSKEKELEQMITMIISYFKI